MREYGKVRYLLQLRTENRTNKRPPRGSMWKSKDRPTKSPKYPPKQKAYYLSRRYAMWRIRESILEFRLRYGLERLFNTSIPSSVYKAFIEMIKCFIYLIKPHKEDNIF